MTPATAGRPFPPPLDSFSGEAGLSLGEVLASRAEQEPLLLAASAIFLLAIVHTFLAPRFLAASHRLQERLDAAGRAGGHSFRVELLHLLGEVEAVFGIWVLPLLLLLALARGVRAPEQLLGQLSFTEPLFVFAIMAIASTRPVLAFTERLLGLAADRLGGTALAWWLSTLVLGPLLGSLITEPAAMVICALLLSRRVLDLGASPRLRYATLGLLFVNISVGGTLTAFAAPPVLMVAGRWGWDTRFMLASFGWKAAVAILVATLAYALLFRSELRALGPGGQARSAEPALAVPAPIVAVHLLALALTVYGAHTPAFFLGVFLAFLAFHQATLPHQQPMDLGPPLLVSFFLAGLVVHGAGQQWWIAPVLARLHELALFFGALGLTAVNDNAAITYLASLVPELGVDERVAVVAGAVAGGGLTVIANAPNPAGQALLGRHFPDGISPVGLLLGALFPTAVAAAAFLLLP